MKATTGQLLEWGGERPLYKQVEEALVSRISSRKWPPGVPLPGESALASEFRVSISTIRAAVRELVEAGVLDRIQGRCHRRREFRLNWPVWNSWAGRGHSAPVSSRSPYGASSLWRAHGKATTGRRRRQTVQEEYAKEREEEF